MLMKFQNIKNIYIYNAIYNFKNFLWKNAYCSSNKIPCYFLKKKKTLYILYMPPYFYFFFIKAFLCQRLSVGTQSPLSSFLFSYIIMPKTHFCYKNTREHQRSIGKAYDRCERLASSVLTYKENSSF